MTKIHIPKEEFEKRIAQLREKMALNDLDALLVYGDEYRKENLRYVSNYWPIFERGALLIGKAGNPILLCAPEGEKMAQEMSVWDDLRLLPDFLCVTVPDSIDYPQANYTYFEFLADELWSGGEIKKIGISGLDAMPMGLYQKISDSFKCEVADANNILFELRRRKSINELICLKEAARIADKGMKAIMEADIIGLTELQACAIAENMARNEGAEHIVFTVFGSGERTNTIVGRPTNKIIEDGDMIMLALAVQYEGYVATCEAPFAVGRASAETKRVIDTLIRASDAALPYLKAGEPMKNFVRAVRDYFRKVNLSEYDVYPPLHGIGCAEAESPYPDENTEEVFEAGMVVNTDISLFGLRGGSNRIEEGFVITEKGAETLSEYVRNYCVKWIENNGYN
jgi:Xaa-Pro aminopeptidase